jgi:hypothetical protein
LRNPEAPSGVQRQSRHDAQTLIPLVQEADLPSPIRAIMLAALRTVPSPVAAAASDAEPREQPAPGKTPS